MGAFGNLGLSAGLGIVLGSSIVLTFIAGFIKVFINKRRMAKHVQLEEWKAKQKAPAEEMSSNRRTLGEGDLFGVRALEAGYFGGVSQSRPTSSSSSYVLAPQTTVADWSRAGNRTANGTLSASSSMTDLTSPGIGLLAGKKVPPPSPLRLQSGDDDNSNNSSGPSANSAAGRSANGLTPGGPAKEWVSPLDVHFGRQQPPSSPAVPVIARPPPSHSRSSTNDSRELSPERYSRDHDRLHNEPTPQDRSRSSYVGRAVSSDQPPENPFSNENHLHSRGNSSLSSFESAIHQISSTPAQRPPSPARGRGLDAPAQDTSRLSGSSQVSVSDFYDSYYSNMAASSHKSYQSDTSRRDSTTLDISSIKYSPTQSTFLKPQ